MSNKPVNKDVVNKDAAGQSESFTGLLVQLAKSSAVVVHDEIELVIQRIREKVKAVRIAVFLLAIGAVIGFAAFLCLCGALIIGLTYYMSPLIAALVTGLGLAVVGGIIAYSGYKQLKKVSS